MGLNHICVSSSPLNQTHLESKSLPLLHQGHSFAFYKILRSKTKNTFPHIFRLPLSMRAFKQALLVPRAANVVEGKSLPSLHMAVFRAHMWNSSVVIQHPGAQIKSRNQTRINIFPPARYYCIQHIPVVVTHLEKFSLVIKDQQK